jgi:membrane-associated protein
LVFLQYGYAAMLGLAFVAAGYLPLPSGLLIVAAGGLIATGYFSWPGAFAALFAGTVLGDFCTYGLARRLTSRRKWDKRCSDSKALRRLQAMLHKRPQATVILSRFVPFANGGVNSLSGMSRLPRYQFVTADAVGNLLYVAAYLWLGFLFGRAWGDARVALLIVSVATFLLGSTTAIGIVFFRSR